MGARDTSKFRTEKPGLIVIMIDQSGSMGNPLGGSTKAVRAADAVNQTIDSIIQRCRKGNRVNDKASILVLKYGIGVEILCSGRVSELDRSFIREYEEEFQGSPDILVRRRVWVEPEAKNGTPMTEAFTTVCKIIEDAILAETGTPPVVVINVTDGNPNEMSSAKVAANRLCALGGKSPGRCLLINVHIGELETSLIFPNSIGQVAEKAFREFLFEISSPLTSEMINRAKHFGIDAPKGGRCFAINAKVEDLLNILSFGSSYVLDPD